MYQSHQLYILIQDVNVYMQLLIIVQVSSRCYPKFDQPFNVFEVVWSDIDVRHEPYLLKTHIVINGEVVKQLAWTNQVVVAVEHPVDEDNDEQKWQGYSDQGQEGAQERVVRLNESLFVGLLILASDPEREGDWEYVDVTKGVHHIL